MKKYLALFCILLLGSNIIAQDEPYFVLSRLHNMYYNPAYAGASNKKNSDILFRYEQPFGDALKVPIRLATLADGKSESLHGGLGGYLLIDHFDTVTFMSSNLSYAYRIDLGETSALRIGVNMINTIRIKEPDNDPFNVRDSIKLKNFKLKGGFGVLYNYGEKFQIGAAFNRQYANFKIKGNPELRGIYYTYFSTQYNFDVTEKIQISPSLFYRGMAKSNLEMNVLFKLGFFIIGGGFSGDRLIYFAGFKTEHLRGVISFDNVGSDIATFNTGAMEMNANAQFE